MYHVASKISRARHYSTVYLLRKIKHQDFGNNLYAAIWKFINTYHFANYHALDEITNGITLKTILKDIKAQLQNEKMISKESSKKNYKVYPVGIIHRNATNPEMTINTLLQEDQT